MRDGRAANAAGTFVIIDPYDTSLCTSRGNPQGPDWLTSSQCDNTDGNLVSNKVPEMLSNGSLAGVYIKMNWDDYENDYLNNHSGKLLSVLTNINSKAPANNPVNLTIGLVAGQYTPCDVLQNVSGYVAVWGADKQICRIMPLVYDTKPSGTNGDAFAASYVTYVQHAVSDVLNFLKEGNTGVAVGALKLGGLNTDYAEVHVDGKNTSTPGSPTQGSKTCHPPANSTLSVTCPGNKTGAEDWYSFLYPNAYAGYYPPGVENTWTLILNSIVGIADSTNHALVEADALQGDNFPPILADQTNVSFSCDPYGYGGNQCTILGSLDPSAMANVGLEFMEYNLLPDLFAAMQSNLITVQTDALYYNSSTDHQPLTATEGYNASGQLGVPVPCWAYYRISQDNNHNVVGFQSATGLSVNAQDYTNYLAGLNFGVNFGAQYLELHPNQVNSYVNADPQGTAHGEAAIKGINTALINPHGNANCQWPGQ